jgi:RHS repeat-associated protein
VELKTGSSTLATYAYNALGQRVQKDDQVQETEFVYDLEGNLIGEYADGTPIREYVYLNGVPVLQIEGATKFYLHPDHLGTPRSATDSAKDIVWTWGGEAFGSNLPDEDPDSDATDTTVNLRFPGQYFDAETGHHYNYFRDYEPLMGRYVQSDPIGLAGGLSTFSYVGSDPLSFVDIYGLWRWPGEIYEDAVRDAQSSGLSGPHNGTQDAYRHCVASCESTRENGALLTYCIAVMNENRGDWLRGQEVGERGMDDINNAIGIAHGRSAASSTDCRIRCSNSVNIGATVNYTSGSTPRYSYR